MPAATRAIIGGSGSHAAGFPGDLHPEARVLGEGLVFETPWGESPPFTLFELGGQRALHVRMHGWRKGVSRGRASRQVFSVLHRAGVRRILSDAGVGSLNHLLDPGDLVVADDFVDMTTDRDRYGAVVGGHLLIMRDPVCASGREAWSAPRGATRRSAGCSRAARTWSPRGRASSRRPRSAFCRRSATSSGQSFCPEVWLARDIGACYAGIYLIVNYGEGVVREWEHDVLAQIFREDAGLMGRILLDALAALPASHACHCRELQPPLLTWSSRGRAQASSPAAVSAGSRGERRGDQSSSSST